MFSVSTERPVQASPLQTSTDRGVGFFASILNTFAAKPTTIHRHRFSPLRLLGFMSLFFGVRGQRSDPFPAVFDLSSLDGTNGLIIKGSSIVDMADVNADGALDLLFGAPGIGMTQFAREGRAYVLFGGLDIARNGTTWELTNLTANDGFALDGELGGRSFGSAFARLGDFNGDLIDDVVIEADNKVHVIFWEKNRRPRWLNETKGFFIDTSTTNSWVISGTGDVTGDGKADLVIGDYRGTPSMDRASAGITYVIPGGTNPGNGGPLDVTMLDGTNGCVFNGDQKIDYSGRSVSILGDVNADGTDDLVIGADNASPTMDRSAAGKIYVIFGDAGLCDNAAAELSSLFRKAGFVINGAWNRDYSGRTVSGAGDVNGDGVDDFLIGAPNADPDPDRIDAGRVFVIFGGKDLGSGGTVDVYDLDGKNGFAINAENKDHKIGQYRSAGGDINGDGISDIAVAAFQATVAGRMRAGIVYIIFGRKDIGGCGAFDLSNLDGRNGFVIHGAVENDFYGTTVSFGDINSDGIKDLVTAGRGDTYVIFGRNLPSSPTTIPTIPGTTSTSTIAQNVLTQSSDRVQPTAEASTLVQGLTTRPSSALAAVPTSSRVTSGGSKLEGSTRPASTSDSTNSLANRTISCVMPMQSSQTGLEFSLLPTAITAVVSAIVSALGTVLLMCACRRKRDPSTDRELHSSASFNTVGEDEPTYSTWPTSTEPHYVGDTALQQLNRDMGAPQQERSAY